MKAAGKTALVSALIAIAALLAVAAGPAFFPHRHRAARAPEHADPRTASAAAPAVASPSPSGVWTDPGKRTRVKLTVRGRRLRGVIVWIKSPSGKAGTRARDVKNPSRRLRSRKIIGMELMGGFTRDRKKPGLWSGGWIYDPQSGKTYSCEITVKDARTLRLRGYWGLSALGQTQSWSRVGP